MTLDEATIKFSSELAKFLNEKQRDENAICGFTTGLFRKITVQLVADYEQAAFEAACQMQINNCLDNLRPTFRDSLAYGDIASAPRPTFTDYKNSKK